MVLSADASAFCDEGQEDEDRDAAVGRICDALRSGAITRNEVLQQLEPRLSDAAEDGVRGRAVLLLAQCVECTEASLTPSQTPIARHLCSRLDDRLSTHAALRALRMIVQAGGDAVPTVEIARTVSRDLYVPMMIQSMRQAAFELWECLAGQLVGAAADAELAAQLVAGFVRALEGEKDPRCLLRALRVAACLARLLPDDASAPQTRATTEALFDAVSVYFPISFKPPPNNPYGITVAGLQGALEDALCGTFAMAPFTLPLALQQLSSADAPPDGGMGGQQLSEDDALALDGGLSLLRAWARARGSAGLAPHAEPLVTALCALLMHAADDAAAEAPSVTLRAVTSASPRSPARGAARGAAAGETSGAPQPSGVVGRQQWELLVSPLLRRCLDELRTAPDSMLSRGSVRVLVAFAGASTALLRLVLDAALPSLIAMLRLARQGAAADGAGDADGSGGDGAPAPDPCTCTSAAPTTPPSRAPLHGCCGSHGVAAAQGARERSRSRRVALRTAVALLEQVEVHDRGIGYSLSGCVASSSSSPAAPERDPFQSPLARHVSALHGALLVELELEWHPAAACDASASYSSASSSDPPTHSARTIAARALMLLATASPSVQLTHADGDDLIRRFASLLFAQRASGGANGAADSSAALVTAGGGLELRMTLLQAAVDAARQRPPLEASLVRWLLGGLHSRLTTLCGGARDDDDRCPDSDDGRPGSVTCEWALDDVLSALVQVCAPGLRSSFEVTPPVVRAPVAYVSGRRTPPSFLGSFLLLSASRFFFLTISFRLHRPALRQHSRCCWTASRMHVNTVVATRTTPSPRCSARSRASCTATAPTSRVSSISLLEGGMQSATPPGRRP